jgi:hypothetical protein
MKGPTLGNPSRRKDILQPFRIFYSLDQTYAELRFGVDVRYQKNLTFHLLFENQSVFDGQLIDDRSNTSNPGGTDVFGRAASTENPGFRVERFWVRYKFPGTPLLLHVGADLWSVSQAGILGNDNPRIAVEAEFGDLQVWASAVVEFEAQRLGLQNDNDSIYYVFGGVYTLQSHRFQLDVVYFRDRFGGADTLNPMARGGLGFQGQKIDSVWIAPSWSGQVGPVTALLQGNLLTGTARGGTAGLPPGVPTGRDYTILAGSVIAYAEADFGMVRPFVGLIYGSGDGNPRDDELHGFQAQPINDSTQFPETPFFTHFRSSAAAAGTRDYSCPARAQGLRASFPAGNPYAIGAFVLGSGPGAGFAECAHSVANVFNSRLGNGSHVGLAISYSNPGTLVIPVGLKVFPWKEHQINGWYVYRAMVDSTLLEVAFGPELAGRRLGTSMYHEVGGDWLWTINLHFDIRLAGSLAIAGQGYKDLARLADCNPTMAGVQACDGNDLALKGEIRFRARF